MRQGMWSAAIAVLVGGCLMSATAAAQGTGTTAEAESIRVNAFGNLGFGGEAEGEVRDTDDDEVVQEFDDVDMETTHGFGGEVSYGLLRYVAVGARVSLNWINTEDWDDENIDRSMLLNVDLAPRARLPVEGLPLEAHLTVPVGLSINFPDDDLDQSNFFAEQEFSTGVSWNLSVVGGATYWFSSSVGAFVEGGWSYQRLQFPSEVTNAFNDEQREFVYDAGFSQVALLGGVRVGL